MTRRSLALQLAALLSLAASTASADPLANGTACVAATDCASGFCVDGVCCDQACAGQCEACDVATGLGTCAPIAGAPHGSMRAPCDTRAASDCAKEACDGTVTATCNGFANDATTTCGADACTTDGAFQPHGVCDGDGGCVSPAPIVCAPFACTSATPACATTCAASSDCAPGNACVSGSCEPILAGASCTADGLSSQSAAGSITTCAPFRCDPATGGCFPSCVSDSECAGSFVCGPGALCADASDPGVAGSGGCSLSRRSSASSAMIAAALAALAIAAERRRRRRITPR